MKRVIKIALLFLCVTVLIGVGIVFYQSRKDTTIHAYQISEATVKEYPANKEFLVQVVKEQFDTTLKVTSDVARGYQIYLIQDPAYAESIGYKMDALGNDFVIRNIHSSVYIFAKTQDSMRRAITYFVQNLLDDRGKLLLGFGESYVADSTHIKKEVVVGQTPIAEYTIQYASKEALEASNLLRYYIHQTADAYLKVQSDASEGSHVLQVALDETLEEGKKSIQITDGQISIQAKDADTLKESIYLFANSYLGWMKAGHEGERISSTTTKISIPDNVIGQDAWMQEREAIIVLWNINYNRGFYLNTDTTLENNIIDFSEEQLYEYVRMLKFCGFTGIQITEMCSAWAGAGGFEAVHDKIRILADAAHSMDMKVTLWVWGAEFTGYGWVDNSVTYYEEGYEYAYESPKAQETFDKYYSIYAELADCCDRLIGHFYDPGNLKTAEDIAFYSKMLREKFHAVNPKIDFGISCWVDVYDKNVFVRELGNDITLYECGHHDVEGDYETFRSYVANTGCRLGTWAWNTCEMEIDQLAQMNFNMDMIRSVYQTARKYDSIYKPSYWSEMDSYHVLNVFSLYCAGQMLINPDIESEVLYQQIAEATVGSEYASDFCEMLSIIQDARNGGSHETYWWKNDAYILKSDDYDARQLLERCNRYIPVLEEMIEKELEANTLPLPVSLKQLLQMMHPHLLQIRDFAEFRIAFAQLEQQYAEGMEPEEVSQKLYEIGEPIDSYHCIIGTWGQIEARAQREMILDFCKKSGVTVPIYAEFDKSRKDSIYAQIAMYQRGKAEPVAIPDPYYQYGLAYTLEETRRLVQEMVEEGLLIQNADNSVYLRDWENYSLHFN